MSIQNSIPSHDKNGQPILQTQTSSYSFESKGVSTTSTSLTESPSYQPRLVNKDFSSLGIYPSVLRYFQFRGRGQNDSTRLWKPMTLRAPVLGVLICLSIFFIIIFEVLYHMSSRNNNEGGGGLAYAATVDSLSAQANFGYLYLPTIIAVCYSLMWSSVDLDAKRLEPWFQLSKPSGSMAVDSLLLQYPFEFLPFIPISAARRKHWRVFYSGTVMLLVFWILTPFQSAIFTARTVQRSATVQIETSGSLVPIQDQINVLDVPFLHIAYGIAWLGQQMPRFTTRTHAMLPFQPASKGVGNLTTETWIASTEVYSTSLNCTPAITKVDKVSNSYTFDNGRGCVVPNVMLGLLTSGVFENGPRYIMAYLGYPANDNLGTPNRLESETCTKEHSDNSLALWVDGESLQNGTGSSVTALFCVPNYHTNRASVTINASTGAVVDIVEGPAIAGGLTPLTSIFSHLMFDYVIASESSPRGYSAGPGILDITLPQTEREAPKQEARLRPLSVAWPASISVGLALGLMNSTEIPLLGAPDKLHEAFERAYQVMFAAAFSTLVTPPESSNAKSLGLGTRKDAPGAIILVRTISVIVEAVLAVIIILACLLWYNSYVNPLSLSSDPASIADMMSVLPPNQELTYHVKHSEAVTSAKLQRMVGKARYHLSAKTQGPPRLEKLSPSSEGFFRADSHYLKDQATTDDSLRPVLPKEHRLTVGAVFVILLSSAIAVIISIDILSSKNNGIRLPTSSSIARSVIENIAPTAFATFLEPAWIILNRLLCLLLPFEQLRRGNAIATSSVDAKYTSIPPQLAVWRALRAKHFLLAAVCVATLSTNVLTVSLAALFFEKEATTTVPFLTKQLLSPRFASTSLPFLEYLDHFYVLKSNASYNTPLPAWSDESFFYLPFDLTKRPVYENPTSTFKTFHASTIGIGTKFRCQGLAPVNNASESAQPSRDTVFFRADEEGNYAQFFTSYMQGNGTVINCIEQRRGNSQFDGGFSADDGENKPLFTATLDETTLQFDGKPIEGTSTIQPLLIMGPTVNRTSGALCQSKIVSGWIRGKPNITASALASAPTMLGETKQLAGANISSTWISCSQTLRSAPFNVTVGEGGKILQADRTGDFRDSSSLFSDTTAQANFSEETRTRLQGMPKTLGWQNTTSAVDWINFALQAKYNTSYVDPALEVPDATVLAPQLEALYAQLFATFLALNSEIFFPSPSDQAPIVGYAVFQETRIFVSSTMLKVSLIIIALNLVVAIAYYSQRPKRFLPRMPTSIASVMAYLAGSRAAEDFKLRQWDKKDARYGYGRFIGTDGQTYVGIESQRFVVPLESENPDVKMGWLGRLRGIGGKKDERRVKTWI